MVEEEFEMREELEEGGNDEKLDYKKDDYRTKVKINEPKLTRDNEIFSTIDDDELVMMVGQEDEGPDLGDNGFCLDCIIQPCVCLLLKLEMKIEILNNHEKSEEEEVVVDNTGTDFRNE